MATLLKVKFYDKPESNAFKGTKTLENSLRNFKKFLQKCSQKWEYATIHHNGNLIHYLHANKGVDLLTKEEYLKELDDDRINLYIVPTYAHKMATGSHSATTIKNASMQDVPNYFNHSVQKILVYQNNRIIATYENGKYL